MTNLDVLCHECPIPYGCNEQDARCLRKKALAAGVKSKKINVTRERVLDLLRCGEFLREQITWNLGINEGTLSSTLAKMVQSGELVREGYGRWATYELAERVQ